MHASSVDQGESAKLPPKGCREKACSCCEIRLMKDAKVPAEVVVSDVGHCPGSIADPFRFDPARNRACLTALVSSVHRLHSGRETDYRLDEI